MNPQNGKGDKRLHARQQCSDQQMQKNWDRAFNKTNQEQKTMTHLMIDLETLGTNSEAPVLSIGAAFFNPSTSEVLATFHQKIEFESACEGRELSPSTVKWWLEQEKEAQDALFEDDPIRASLALEKFVQWIDEHSERDQVKPWGNGATFDISIIESLLHQYSLSIPWKFYNVRDVRTIVDCAKPLVQRDSIKFEGVKHDALADALHQAKYVSEMWQALRRVA